VSEQDETIDITGLDKAEVFQALYNRAKTQGAGILHYTPEDMTLEEAREAINGGHSSGGDYVFTPPGMPRLYFDYYKGRVMKVDLSGDELRTWGYDRDNGDGAARRALEPLLTATANTN
jgi:hypothetical protein